MSSITSQLPAGTSAITPGRQSDNAFGELSSQEFLDIILTEMTRQDPLEPSDTSALLEQLSAIRAIESDLQLGDRLESIVTQSQFASATGLIGKLVSGIDERNDPAAGFVVSVSRTDDGPVLNLDNGQRMPFSGLSELVDPDLFSDDAGDDQSSGGTDSSGSSAEDDEAGVENAETGASV